MPRVPGGGDISPVQRSAVNQPLPSVRATPETFGAGVARADQEMGQVVAAGGGQITKHAFDQVVADNIREIKGADVALSKAEKDIFFGDGTEQNPGFSNLEGQNAVDAARGAQDAMLAKQEEISKGLSTQKQRDRFAAASAQAMVNFDARVADHATTQRKVADAKMAELRLEAQITNAALDYKDPNRMSGNFSRARGEGESAARARGFDEDAIAIAGENAANQVAFAAVDAAIAAGDTDLAAKLIADYEKGKVLQGDLLTDAKAKLKTGKVRFESQRVVDQAVTQFPGPSPAAVAARTKASRDPSLPAAVRDGAVNRMTVINAEISRAFKDLRIQDFRDNAALIRGGVRTEDLETLGNMTPQQEDALRLLERRIAVGVPITSTPGLMKYLTNLSPDELAKRSPDKLEPMLSAKDAKFMRAAILAARLKASDPDEIPIPFTILRKFETRITELSKRKLNPAVKNRLEVIYQEEIQKIQRGQTTAVTSDQADDVLDKMITPQTLEGSFFSGPGPSVDKTLPLVRVVVDEDLKAPLTAEFEKAHGRKPTALELKQAFVNRVAEENR